MNKPRQNIFNIPASLSFSDTLASALIKRYQDNLSSLSQTILLLPTRRACRVMQDAFLRQTNGKPILLPQLKAIGDIDEEELLLQSCAEKSLNIPPALSSLKRQILLTRLISTLPDFSKNIEQNMALAQALGALMDQIHTENLQLSDLPNLVDKEAFADHWQITVDFLEILSDHWPKILEAEGCIDAADRRNRLILALCDHWGSNPPPHPVIAAGSTGSIYATKSLLKIISNLPQGQIILPGLDPYIGSQAWEDLEEGHPQATLKILLEGLGIERKDVQPLTNDIGEQKRERIISDMMLPASFTSEWGKDEISHDDALTLTPIHRYDCETIQEEADLIALLLRETLEMPSKTAALITPNRGLARRVAQACKRWDITLDDSAGQALSETPLGLYLLSSIAALIDGARPFSLLSLLKNQYAKGNGFDNYRTNVRLLEYQVMHGTVKMPAFAFYKSSTQDEALISFIDHLDGLFEKPLHIFQEGTHNFNSLLTEHLTLSEALANNEHESGAASLWQGEIGDAASLFFADLKTYATVFPDMTGTEYLTVITQLMKQVTIRPKFGTHPRLQILGQLEARLIQADRVILAGLNEGTWPPNVGYSPWMSRPMRQDFGLPPLERDLTLAAHDFVQGICQNEVFLTRSKKMDGTPTLPARWLERLETYVQANKYLSDFTVTGPHLEYLKQLHHAPQQTPIKRPAPTPPVEARPRKLSVTRIETLMKDPYAIYASKILGLYSLDPIERPYDAAQKGNILHHTLNRFMHVHRASLNQDDLSDFLTIAKEEFIKETNDQDMYAFYRPRLIRLGEWFINHEKQWRHKASFTASEIEGTITLDNNFSLQARADRIDQLHEGGMAIIDYKSGGTYSKKKMETGGTPQLPLEALILDEGGFSSISDKKTHTLSYWKLTGGNIAGDITELSDIEAKNLVENTKAGLTTLLCAFDDAQTPYYAIPVLENAPRFNDYEHLERVKEWAALDGEQGEAA